LEVASNWAPGTEPANWRMTVGSGDARPPTPVRRQEKTSDLRAGERTPKGVRSRASANEDLFAVCKCITTPHQLGDGRTVCHSCGDVESPDQSVDVPEEAREDTTTRRNS
jgi:hypothetical protein